MPVIAEPCALLLTVTMTFPVILSQPCEPSWEDGADEETKAWEAAACPRSLSAELQVGPDVLTPRSLCPFPSFPPHLSPCH